MLSLQEGIPVRNSRSQAGSGSHHTGSALLRRCSHLSVVSGSVHLWGDNTG